MRRRRSAADCPRDQQQHAVVDALAAQLPGLGHADAVLLDLLRRGGLDGSTAIWLPVLPS
jgi:hypothetical protein